MTMERSAPWGPIPVADAHVHFFSHRFFSLIKPGAAPEETASQLGWQAPPEDPEKLAAVWAHELDQHGVAHSALIASVPGDESSVAAAERAFPDRFFGCAMINPNSEWRPADLAEIYVACLFPAMHRYSIQSSEARQVFEWAKENERSVFVHCGVLSVGIRKRLGLPSPFDMRFSNPIDLHAVALSYPTVPIIVPHFGAGYFREALMLADLCPNVYLDTSSSNSWIRYQESHLDLRQVFRRAIDVVGPKRLLFGTDSSFFPRGWHHQIFDEQAKALYEIGLSEADAKAVFSENFLRIIRR